MRRALETLAMVLLTWSCPGGEPVATIRPVVTSTDSAKRVLQDAKHVVRAAALVVEGELKRFLPPSPRVRFQVSASLKGSAESEQLTVDLSKAAAGLWPKKGEQRILCLARGASGGHELVSFHASVLPATEAVRGAIRGWVAEWGLSGTSGTSGTSGASRPEPDTLRARRAASEAVFVGTLGEVESAGTGGAAEGPFQVDRPNGALLGYGGRRGPVTVHFPASGKRPEPPKPGRYLLFLKSSRGGDGLDVVDAARLTDDETEAAVTEEVRASLSSRTGRLTTIQATLAEWREAWNARDVGRCIKCYSRDNGFRKRHEAGGEGCEDLGHQVRGFAGKVEASVIRVAFTSTEEAVAPATGEKGPRRTAKVTVAIRLTVPGFCDRRTVEMSFIREDGEWLILDEGF